MDEEEQPASPAKAEDIVCEALVALLHHHDPHKGSVVVVEQPQSGKFVAFGPGWSLEMDVPHLTLTNEEADRAYEFFAALGEKYLIEYDAPNPETSSRI
jgi:hypothetical protein